MYNNAGTAWCTLCMVSQDIGYKTDLVHFRSVFYYNPKIIRGVGVTGLQIMIWCNKTAGGCF